METEYVPNIPQETDESANAAKTLGKLDWNCEACHPLTPLQCVTECRTWKLKNEFRALRKKMENPSFIFTLLNTLKNRRRVQVLAMISKEPRSAGKLQQGLKKLDYRHSQETIVHEYLHPLLEAGLARQDQDQYRATFFGRRIFDVIGVFPDIADLLPPHSECHEEQTLRELLDGSKSYEDLGNAGPSKSVARVLSRLQSEDLVMTNEEKDYVFFFRTQRDPEKERLSLTERKVHENIPCDGVSARRLAVKAGISLRRTYKYLRRLKGKKLVFARRRLRRYTLTEKGIQVAGILERIRYLIAETLNETTRLIGNEEEYRTEVAMYPSPLHTEKKSEASSTLRAVRKDSTE